MADVAGLKIVGFPENVSPVSAIVVIKCLDEDGDLAYYCRATDSLTVVEAIGMAAYAKNRLHKLLSESDE